MVTIGLLLPFFLLIQAPNPGPLLVVGGGAVPMEVYTTAVRLTGIEKPRVAVVPFASARETAGAAAQSKWLEAKAGECLILDDGEPEKAKLALEQAHIIWLGGGAQTQLVERLRQANLLELIRSRHQSGVVVAGTSAGAAAMSVKMMTGKAELDAILPQSTELVEGIGLWPQVIVDQHFHRRGRFNRLLAAVLDHPESVGVGIDENTAVLVRGNQLEVIGKSSVLVLDAREVKDRQTEKDRPAAGRHLKLHLIAAGMTFSLSPPEVLEKNVHNPQTQPTRKPEPK